MNKLILAVALAACMGAQAQDWKGAGEFGLAITGGNTDTQTINGRLGVTKESDAWKHDAVLGILKAQTNNGDTARRFDLGWTSGYKISDMSYLFGTARYENDRFGPYSTQIVAGAGYGIYAIKDEQTTLLFEVGPGYRRGKSQVLAGVTRNIGTAAAPVLIPVLDSDGNQVIARTIGPNKGSAILRGKMDFNHKLNDVAAIYDTFLLEAGSNNKFMQNDLGVAVKLSEAFALKTGFQIRRNSKVASASVSKTDRLFTTNLVYSF
jgi:putative salt-induced outer membrane protein